MSTSHFHRFQIGDTRYAVDPDTCFCFQCDDVSWDVTEFYPETSVNRIHHMLDERHPSREIDEVIGELEWLRQTDSICPKEPAPDKLFERDQGLNQLHLAWADTPQDVAQRAITLLFARATHQNPLTLFVRCKDGVTDIEALAQTIEHALNTAVLAGKTLQVRVVTPIHLKRIPQPLKADIPIAADHDLPQRLKTLARAVTPADLNKLEARITLTPIDNTFADTIDALFDAGCRDVALDLATPYLAEPFELDEPTVAEVADRYVARLLRHDYVQLEPFTSLFRRIHEGQGLRRTDPAGLNAVAVATNGDVYADFAMQDDPAFRLGSLDTGLDDATLNTFQNVGADTTAVCRQCWARNLCGGGRASIHQRLSGCLRTPCLDWCDAQRRFFERLIAAFSQLTSQGIDFTRLHTQLRPSKRPSLWQIAKAAFHSAIGIRPIEEDDAEWLTQWENWNDAAYFLATETNILLATRYDREMDALHGKGLEREMVLLQRDGTPMGLFRVRPDREPGVAHAWLYFRNRDDYASEPIRRSLRYMLAETARDQSLRRLMVPVAPWEKDSLGALLNAIGFSPLGVQREALFLHGARHDLTLFAVDLDVT